MDCTPPTALSSNPQAVSTSLSPNSGSQVASLTRPFHQTWVLTAQASARSRLPHHPPDHMIGALGIPIPSASGVPVTATTQPLSALRALLCPAHQPPDHMTLNSAVSMPQPSKQQATLTTTAYNSSFLDIYSQGMPLL